MDLWRIASDAPDWTADKLTGAGAEKTGGRWNRRGTPVIYTSTNIALATLETLVHINVVTLPMNRYLVRMEVPGHVWELRQILPLADAPVGWDAEPYGKVSLDIGEQWLAERAAAILLVPSIMVPEECNALINPLHPDAKAIKPVKLRKFVYDRRLHNP